MMSLIGTLVVISFLAVLAYNNAQIRKQVLESGKKPESLAFSAKKLIGKIFK